MGILEVHAVYFWHPSMILTDDGMCERIVDASAMA